MFSPTLLKHSISPSFDDWYSAFGLSSAFSIANPQIAMIITTYNLGVAVGIIIVRQWLGSGKSRLVGFPELQAQYDCTSNKGFKGEVILRKGVNWGKFHTRIYSRHSTVSTCAWGNAGFHLHSLHHRYSEGHHPSLAMCSTKDVARALTRNSFTTGDNSEMLARAQPLANVVDRTILLVDFSMLMRFRMTSSACALISNKWAAVFRGGTFIRRTRRKDIRTYFVNPVMIFFAGIFSRMLNNWKREIYEVGYTSCHAN